MKTATHKTVTTLLTSLTLAAIIATSAAGRGPLSGARRSQRPAWFAALRFLQLEHRRLWRALVFVRYGGRASQLGLEPGDIILSLNGMPLTYRGSWNDALSHAVFHDGGLVRLRVRDVRTGHVVRREIFVGGHGDGPVEHYNVGGGPVVHHNVAKPHPHNHNNIGNAIKTINKLVN